MGLTKAFIKLFLHSANRGLTNHNKKKAPSKAFKHVGKKIDKAKKTGKYFDGRKEYRKEKKKRIKKADEKGKDRDKFIDDL